MRILGIDPGFGLVGYGIIDFESGRYTVIDYGVIETFKADELPTRLAQVFDGVNYLLEKYKPDEVSMEELFFAKNIKTAMNVAQARGVIALAVIKKKIPLYEYTPQQIKQALTGIGNSKKQQVEYMVQKFLNIKDKIRPDDASDALACAVCHANTGKALKQQFKF